MVEAPILGYRASLRRTHDPRYKAFKHRVRSLADAEGIPDDLGHNDEARMDIVICWKKRARIDGKNVLGAIEDSIFRRDRRVLRGSYHAMENVNVESVRVILEIKA